MNIKSMYSELAVGQNPANSHELFASLYAQCKADKKLKPGEREHIMLLALFGLCLSDLYLKKKSCLKKHMTDMKKLCDENYNDDLKEFSAVHYSVVNRLIEKNCSDADIKIATEEAMLFNKMS